MAYTTIDDPSAHHQTKIYTGNGNDGQAYTFDGNSDMQPDWLWVKNRSNSGPYSGNIFDSTRGANKGLFPDATNAEATNGSYGYLGAFQSDGFTVTSGSSGDERVNNNNDTYVMWGWKANGGTTTSTSASGSTGDNTDIIASARQTNTTAGFSIITYTGDSTAGKKVTHGLGATPEFIIIKNRDNGSEPWAVFTTTTGVKALALNTTAAQATDSGYWSDTNPDSTHFTVGSHGATGAAAAFVAYAFTGIQGYSKFGVYKGNGNNDGPFVYTGFKPAWVMYKRSSDTGNWRILDNQRNTFNPINNEIYADLSNAEAQDTQMGFYANGFKLRNGSSVGQNGNGSTYIYMAFAEHPFVSSKGVPVTAR